MVLEKPAKEDILFNLQEIPEGRGTENAEGRGQQIEAGPRWSTGNRCSHLEGGEGG